MVLSHSSIPLWPTITISETTSSLQVNERPSESPSRVLKGLASYMEVKPFSFCLHIESFSIIFQVLQYFVFVNYAQNTSKIFIYRIFTEIYTVNLHFHKNDGVKTLKGRKTSSSQNGGKESVIAHLQKSMFEACCDKCIFIHR